MTFKPRGCFNPRLANHYETPNKPKARKPTKKSKAQRKAEKRAVKITRLRAMDYADYLETWHWKKKRGVALRHYGHQCNRCSSADRLQVHHRSYKRLGDERMEDLEVLCEGCHQNEHEGDKFWIKDPMTREFVDMFA